MNITWKDIVKDFPTTPFLFVGSGLTRRYLGLPDWETLLKHFAEIISDDPFIFQRYMLENNDDFTKVGSALEKDFNKKWFENQSIRSNSEDVLTAVANKISPFKAELAYFIKSNSTINTTYNDEINLLKSLTEKNIAGFITTNYDTFLEDISKGYKVYNSQEDLIFSPIQEMAEIFKIHGSVTAPDSIVITAEDYKIFDDRCAYLAAKLLTIFMEYPIIFIGYSLTDQNIQKILSAITACLSTKNIDRLQNRFIFVKRNTEINDDIKIGTYSKEINGQTIFMTQLETNNFKLIFEPLSEKQAGIPVRILRTLKEQFYNYTITNIPSKHIYVNEYDPNIPDDQICFSIGQNSQLVKRGLVGMSLEQCYKAIVFDNIIPFSADDILTFAMPNLLSQTSKLPVFKFLHSATQPHNDIREKITYSNFDDLINTSFKRYRERKTFNNRSVNGIIQEYTNDGILDSRALEYIAYLTEDEINVDELGEFLRKYLTNNPEALSRDFSNQRIKTNLRRLIRIYDFLKYH